jgi:hypothetical protein
MMAVAVLIAILGLFPGQASVQDDETSVEVSLRGGAVWAFSWGTASARNSFTGFERGGAVDLRDDLGLLHGAPLADLALLVQFEHRHRVALHALFGEVSARTVLERTFEYNDNVFEQGEHAQSRLEIDCRDLEYAYRFATGPRWTLWAGAGGRWAHVNVGIRSSSLDPDGSMEATTAVYPTLNAGLAASGDPSWSLGLEVRGSPAALPVLPSDASRGRFVEVRATLGWNLTDFVRLEAGGTLLWMWHRWTGREPDRHFAVNEVDLRLAGPFAGLNISF